MPRPHTRVSMIEADFVALRKVVEYITEHYANGYALCVTEMGFYEDGSVHLGGHDFHTDADITVYSRANGYIEVNGEMVRSAYADAN